ncbi:hypothetical protein DXG01_011953 [Tephrocybe rancida]|nr:hypothetical protein DXG01_011953 [Tephrocybe rancida]
MASSEKGSNTSLEKEEHHRVVPMTPMERQAALDAALAVDPGVSRFSKRAFYMYLITLVACCCSGDSGFDGTVMGGINSMTQYQQYFHMKTVGSKTGIIFGIYTIGSLSGTIPASYLPDRFGRRFSMFFGNLLLCVGAIITANAKDMPMFLGGRFLTGQMAASGMMVATGRWSGTLSWRLPLYIQLVPAALNVLFVFLCPESSNGDVKSPLVQLEMREIEEVIQINGADSMLLFLRDDFPLNTPDQ